MDTQKVKLSQVTENVENPRTITDRNLHKLITSILVFPKMLALRPIVVDDTMTALGGNMRLRALSAISTFSPEQIANRLQGCTDYEKKTPAEREALINYWRAWLEEPTTEVANDKTLTEDEKRAFIIKDNVAYGEWDEGALTDGWDAQQLEEWNIDTWEQGDEKVEKGEKDDLYTKKIISPTYEPSVDCPRVKDLVNTEKASTLLERINNAKIPKEIKEFLTLASYRHVVFNYAKIADFYAHSQKQVQELMEESALVIIDAEQAIENGYMQLAKDVFEMFDDAGEGNEE